MSYPHICFAGGKSEERSTDRVVLLVIINKDDSVPMDRLCALLPEADIVPTGLQPDLFAEHDPAKVPAQLILTARQLEILHYVTKGMTNKEIARILGISNFTVRNHVSKLLNILNVSKRQELRAA
ncbi:helix-turn-helix transcriptional regulator [Sphingorhabdus sp.]|uniref:response regulator transcription factor n=1 Tax=Sphingorhabdus sp. TaxID=1902408 RepID=UPI002B5D19D3|nr:helix-turn-helix transcriptional regulator [Sphingorhabdus sp.]HMT41099.1 helix-turn-helix transcriptional regulator [Sphingorhabdus sp.]